MPGLGSLGNLGFLNSFSVLGGDDGSGPNPYSNGGGGSGHGGSTSGSGNGNGSGHGNGRGSGRSHQGHSHSQSQSSGWAQGQEQGNGHGHSQSSARAQVHEQGSNGQGQGQEQGSRRARTAAYNPHGHNDTNGSATSTSHLAPLRASTSPYTSAPPVTSPEDRRAELRRIAEETLTALQRGYSYKGRDYMLEKSVLEAKEGTVYYAPEAIQEGGWERRDESARGVGAGKRRAQPAVCVSVLQISTLDGARILDGAATVGGGGAGTGGPVGVLNFASATKPGGGFKNGAEAQEESIARSSTLYPTLLHTAEATKFYDLHKSTQFMHRDSEGQFYTHAMIYSPGVVVFRDDDGMFTYPFKIDVLSCAAVNAGEARKATSAPVTSGLEVEIEKEMKERMGRILYVFEQRGVRNLVLGTFGTGVFRNNIGLVARLWANFLVVGEARFQYSFDRIVFAITGEQTFAEFQGAFDAWRPKRGAGS